MKMQPYHPYNVALSFAGADRKVVEQVANWLRFLDISVFYDAWEKHTLLGQDLYTYLADIYENKARICLIFISKNYVSNSWPRHELRFAQARSFATSEPYVIPIRLDSTPCPGVPDTVAYLDARTTPPSSIALIVMRKLGARIHSSDVGYYVFAKNMKYRLFWNGNLKADGHLHLVWLGEKPRDHYHPGVWSPDDSPLLIEYFKASDSQGELCSFIKTDTSTQKTYTVRFREPLVYGQQLKIRIQFHCRRYYKDLLQECSDSFRIGVPTRNWAYEWTFPRKAIIKTASILRHYGNEVVNHIALTNTKNNCPVVACEHTNPPTGTVFMTRFLLDRENV